MADLSSYFQVAPTSAAFMLGQQQGLANDQTQAETSRLQALTQQLGISNDQATKMNPLLLDHQGLLNQELEAKNPGFAADSRLAQIKADTAAKTQASDISAHLSDDHVKILKNNAEEISQKSQALGRVGIALASGQGQQAPGTALNIPALLQSNGLDPNDDFVKGVVGAYGSTNPQLLGKHMVDVAQQTLRLTEPYLQAKEVEDARAASAQKVAGIDSASRERVAQMQINAGRFQSKKVATDLDGQIQAALVKAPKAADQYAILTRGAALAQNANQPELATKYALAAQALERQAQAQANPVHSGGIDAGAVAGLPTVQPTAIHSAAVDKILGGNSSDSTITDPGRTGVPKISTVAQLRQAHPDYADKSDADLRAAYKTKFGVDLK